jgi:hypothetical protein
MDANHGKGMFFIVLLLSLALAVFLTSFAGSVTAAAKSLEEMRFAAFPDHQKSEGIAIQGVCIVGKIQGGAMSGSLWAHPRWEGKHP